MQYRDLPLLQFGSAVSPVGVVRRRHSDHAYHAYRPIPFGERTDAAAFRTTEKTSWTSFVPGACFAVAMLVYMATGMLCLAFPAEATSSFDTHVIPETATCVRVSRHTNYVAVDLVLGSPSSLLSLLLRMDIVKGHNDTAVRLFSNRVAESDSVACTGTVCTDVALVHMEGPSSDQVRSVVQFEYTNPTTEALTYGTAITMKMDGEMTLKHGYDYYLTSTHLCWTPATADMHGGAEPDPSDTEGAVPARIVGGSLRAEAAGLEQTATMRSTPAGVAQVQNRCPGGVGEVALFPGAAADEARWLGLASERAYENSPDGVDDRRSVVEVGTHCASNFSEYTRAYSLYQLDCLSVYVSCDTNPSVPYRRVAADQMRLHIPNDGSNIAYVFTSPDKRLESLPKLEDGGDAMYLAFVKLGLMTLAAAVTWMRATKSTSSHDRLFIYCIRMAHCPVVDAEPVDRYTVWEDATVGLAAIGARFGVAIWRTVTLAVDGQMRAPIAQLVAAVLSLLQWILRYFVLDRKCEAPLTKLGGSTALVDATCAVMLGFAQPPLLVSSISRFDPTARLLTSLLITTLTLHRCLFAVACCGLLWAVATDDMRKPIEMPATLRILSGGAPSATVERFAPEYVPYVLFALVAWILQTCSVAILLADVFCLPLAHSMARSVAGGWVEMAMAIFAATAAAGLPQLMRTLGYLAQDPIGKTKEESK